MYPLLTLCHGSIVFNSLAALFMQPTCLPPASWGFFTFIRPVSIFFHPEKPYSGSDQLSILTFLFLSRSFLRARGNICIQETPNVLCLWVLSACNFSRTS